jgi:hypothetical protein
VDDAIQIILAAANHDGALIDSADLTRLPASAIAWLTTTNVLAPAAPAKHVRCELCDDAHLVEVEQVTVKRRTRFFAVCGEAGMFPVNEEALRRWRIDLAKLADSIAIALCEILGVQGLVDQRAWRLGTRTVHGVSRPVLLFRGLGRADSADVQQQATRAVAADNAIALTLDAPGEYAATVVNFAAVLPLHSVLKISETGLDIDASRLGEAIPQALVAGDKPVVDATKLTVSYKGQTCAFSSRAKTLFKLLSRLSARPGHRVPFPSLRSDVFDDEYIDDVSIGTSVNRLRTRLREHGMNALASCIRVDSIDGGAVLLDLTEYGRSTKSK